MRPVILYYTPGTCAFGPLVFLRQTGLPFSACHVAREQRQQPAYLAINPRGQVPALRTDDRTLVENAAILLHVAAKAHPKWLPADGTEERDAMHYWLSWLDSGFHTAFFPFFKPQLYLHEAADHDRLRARAQERIREAFSILDAHLRDRAWMLGEGPSLLDPYVFAMSRWAYRAVDGLDPWPGVLRHRERLLEDPAIQFGLALEEQREPDAPGGFRGHVALEDRGAT